MHCVTLKPSPSSGSGVVGAVLVGTVAVVTGVVARGALSFGDWTGVTVLEGVSFVGAADIASDGGDTESAALPGDDGPLEAAANNTIAISAKATAPARIPVFIARPVRG